MVFDSGSMMCLVTMYRGAISVILHLNSVSIICVVSSPDMRMMPIADANGGVAIAAMVS